MNVCGNNDGTMKKFMLRRMGVAHDSVGATKPTLQSCLEAVLDHSDSLVDDILAGLKASLTPVKSKTLYGHQNPAGQAAIETLCAQVDPVKTTFSVALRAAIYGGDLQRGRALPLVRFDDFQFLEDEQIDANIELALTEQEILMSVGDVLQTLDALMGTLLGWVTVHAHLNPLKPESFVYALRQTLAKHVPNDAERTALMTPAAGLMGASLRQLYKEVSDWLRSQGVEPAGPVGLVNGQLGGRATGESSVTRTLLTLDKLRKLLAGELELGPQGGGVATDFTHTVPASYVALEDMKLVEPMMKRLAARASQGVVAKPAASVVTRGGKAVHREHAQSKYLGRQLGEEVVRLMLENLMQDRRLLAPVRRSLLAMEPLLIKLSQSDARFFSDKQHSARQFLDKITHRSLAFSSIDEPEFGAFHAAFELALEDVSRRGGDAAAFAEVLHHQEEVWTSEEHAQRQRAEDAARALLHAEQRNMLAQRLSAQFSAQVENKSVPDMVATFLRGPWAQVVAQAQLSCADGAIDADGYLALVDDLIWSVRLRLARRNRARLVQMVPGMLVKMRHGLSLISYPSERVAVFFDELITFHEQAFETPRPLASDDQPPTAAAQESALRSVALQPDEVWMVDGEAADSGYLEQIPVAPECTEEAAEVPDPAEQNLWSADSLNTGSWVDLALGGQWVRAELTWASPHRTLFMFISSGGLAHSMSRRTMDRLRTFGLIRLVSDGRVMDHALDAVAQIALRNNPGRSGADN
jgi:hypothetical protein